MELVAAHQATLTRLRLVAGNGIHLAWVGLRSYNEADVARFLTRALPIVTAAQRHAATVTAAYLARRLGIPAPRFDLEEVTGPAVRNGTPPEEVYRRPFVTVWGALANGTRWEDAVAQGAARARSAAETDVQLAFRSAARTAMRMDPRVVGYRRVPDPKACILCLAASTQRYRTADLMPIHSHCGCDIEPIIGTRDPGHVIDRERLAALKQDPRYIDMLATAADKRAAGAPARAVATARSRADRARTELNTETDVDRRERLTARAAYWDSEAKRIAADTDPVTVTAVHTHGELGPVLTTAGHHFDDLH